MGKIKIEVKASYKMFEVQIIASLKRLNMKNIAYQVHFHIYHSVGRQMEHQARPVHVY